MSTIGFFNDISVPNMAKITSMMCMLKGYWSQNKNTIGQNCSQVVVPYKGTICSINYVMGSDNDTVNEMSAKVYTNMFKSSALDIEGVLDNKYSDEQVVKMCAERAKEMYNFNDKFLQDDKSMMMSNLARYCNAASVYESATFGKGSNTREAFDKMVNIFDEVYSKGTRSENDKKKDQMMQMPTAG